MRDSKPVAALLMAPLHPTIAQALAPWTPPSPEADLRAYLAALQRHDWEHEFSDDHSVWRKGRRSLALLRVMQQAVDADHAIWNAACPKAYRVHTVGPSEATPADPDYLDARNPAYWDRFV